MQHLFQDGTIVLDASRSSSLTLPMRQKRLAEKAAHIASLLLDMYNISGDISAMQEAARYTRLSSEISKGKASAFSDCDTIVLV